MRRFWILWMGGTIVALFSSHFCFAALSGSLSEKAILERIKPSGAVTIQAGDFAAPMKPVAVVGVGQQRYEEVCHICHGSGIGGSPKLGDKADWAPRIAEGIEVLVQRALTGYKTMPARGTCMNCSDAEIRESVEYMVSHSK